MLVVGGNEGEDRPLVEQLADAGTSPGVKGVLANPHLVVVNEHGVPGLFGEEQQCYLI